MSDLTEEVALDDLVAIVTTVERIGAVVKGEPIEVRDGMVTVHPTGATPTDYSFRVSQYAQGADVLNTQTAIRAKRQALEDQLRADARYGPSQWDYGWIDGTDVWFCHFDMTRGREDF